MEAAEVRGTAERTGEAARGQVAPHRHVGGETARGDDVGEITLQAAEDEDARGARRTPVDPAHEIREQIGSGVARESANMSVRP